MSNRRKAKLYLGPVNLDLDSNSASIDLPGGGEVRVGPDGVEVSTPDRGAVRFGPGGGSADVPGLGHVEVSRDGFVFLPDGTVWNSRWMSFPDVGSTPTPGGSVPIPYPNVGDTGGAPFNIPIPVPNFVVERFDIPIPMPKITAHAFDLPLPMLHAKPTPIDVPWPVFTPPRPPAFTWSMPELPELLPTTDPPAPYAIEIKAAIGQAVGRWLAAAEVTRGVIHGPFGTIPQGALRSTVDLKNTIRGALVHAGVPLVPYASFTDLLAKAWVDWFDAFTTVVHYPAFANWPGPSAQAMPAITQTLSVGQSGNAAGLAGMSAVALYAAVANLLDPTANDTDIENLLRQLTTWFAGRFHMLTLATNLANVLGHGPVPAYAPPAVPFGPVINGQILPSRNVLVGPNLFLVP